MTPQGGNRQGPPPDLAAKLATIVAPHLFPGEQVLATVPVQPVRAPVLYGPGKAAVIGAGERLAQVRAVKGGKGTIAAGFPDNQGRKQLLSATDQRLLFLRGPRKLTSTQPVWELPRAQVLGVERRPRLQFPARFRLHFSDGSSVALLTRHSYNVEALADALGRCDSKGIPIQGRAAGD